MIKPLHVDFMGKLLNVGDSVITPFGSGTVALVHGKVKELRGWRVLVSISWEDLGEVKTSVVDRHGEGLLKL